MADPKQIEDKSAETPDELAGSEAPLLEHLVELRKRLIYSAIAIVVLMAFCFIFASTIYEWLLSPCSAPFSWASPLLPARFTCSWRPASTSMNARRLSLIL